MKVERISKDQWIVTLRSSKRVRIGYLWTRIFSADDPLVRNDPRFAGLEPNGEPMGMCLDFKVNYEGELPPTEQDQAEMRILLDLWAEKLSDRVGAKFQFATETPLVYTRKGADN